MPDYIVANIETGDRDAFEHYKQASAASMQEFGIVMLGFSEPATMLEGVFSGAITVVLQVESVQRAREWFASDAYAKAFALRPDGSKFTIAVVSGVEG